MSGEVKTVPVEDALIEEISALTVKHGNPTGTDYEQGVNDHGIRVLGVVMKALAAAPSTQPGPRTEGEAKPFAYAWRWVEHRRTGKWFFGAEAPDNLGDEGEVQPLFASPLQAVRGDGSSAREADTHRAGGGAVRVFIDCEFDGHDGPLLSIALVREDGDSIHIQADIEPMDLWVRQNVMTVMDAHRAPQSAKVYHNEVGGVIRAFLGDDSSPVIVADSPVDIGRFCRALSTGPDGGWASADYPRMSFEVHNIDCYPTTLPGAVQHNAWWDAMALRQKLAAQPDVPLPAAPEAGE